MIRLGTRGSKLALIQVELVRPLLFAAGFLVEPVIIRTSGDRGDREKLGAFVGELQQAVLDGEVDAALHCLKDLPTTALPGLTLAAFLARDDPRDAILCGDVEWTRLPYGAHVGTGSLRRTAQLRRVRPDLRFSPLVGNVDSRLRRLAEGEFDAIVLAMAGLERLGLVGSLSIQPLEVDVMMPAVGQGVLVLETRSGVDLGALDHGPTRLAAETERTFLAAFGTGCRLPIGAYADGNRLRARVVSPDGQREMAMTVDGQGAEVGGELAERFLALGARSLIGE